jgi:hypothetical protein
MKHIFLVLAVVAMMAVVMAAPAFASRPSYRCVDSTGIQAVPSLNSFQKDVRYLRSLGYVCTKQ